jgi:hypothetical protein
MKVDTMDSVVLVLSEVLLDWPLGSIPNHAVRSDLPEDIIHVYTQQAQLGWKNLFKGIFGLEWSIMQNHHYTSKGSRQTGAKWIGTLSAQIWKAIFAMWTHCNQVLHKSGAISEFSGSRELLSACFREMDLGPQGLPEIYHHFFDITRNSFRSETIDYKRNWFSIVRQAREDVGHAYDDFFSACSSSCQWAGLDKSPVSRDDNNSVH